jgi:hypothetical protein
MQKNPFLLIVVGLIFLGLGAVMQFTGGLPRADAALVLRCQQEMKSRGAAAASMAKQCSETAFATAMTATDAQSAARAISAANSSEIGSNGFSMFLIGIGLALTTGGVVLRQKQTR